MTVRLTPLLLGLSSTLLLVSQLALGKVLEPITFTEDQADTTIEIVEKLGARHYRNKALDDELSSRYLDLYLDTLDPTKSYFYQSDIDKFERYRLQFDDFLKTGKLAVNFDIFDSYRQRVANRVEANIAQLSDTDFKFDFSKDESLEIDREGAVWPADKRTADELWRKRLKSSVLSLKIAGKTVAEARETLSRRLNNQLKRIDQQDGADAFEVVINSLTLLYDPHTSYLSPRTLANFNISMSLSLEGIGAVLQSEDEHTKIVRLIAAGPADKQGGLKPADKIVAVGQGLEGEMVDVVGWRLDEVVKLIRGPKNTTVRLEAIDANAGAGDSTKVVRINRGKVKLEEQAAKKTMLELTDGERLYKIGVIDVPAFYIDFEAYRKRDPNFKSTTRDVAKLVLELQAEKVDGIVIDLRNNGGGSLQEATTLTDLFIDPGPVVQIRQTNERISRHYQSRGNALYRGPMVVLINRLSASASEIFAGAIQDYNRGLIVGVQSFGKGTVQSLTPVKEGQLKITESKFYRVSGDSTQHRGVLPDIALPALVDLDLVGESSYDNALPWDQIHAAPHNQYYDLQALIPELTSEHKKRVKNDPDFTYLLKQLAIVKENRDIKSISLMESKRKIEKEALENKHLSNENQRRQAKGLSEYASVDALKKGDEAREDTAPGLPTGPVSSINTQEEESSNISEDGDPLLNETGYILIDFIESIRKSKSSKLANF